MLEKSIREEQEREQVEEGVTRRNLVLATDRAVRTFRNSNQDLQRVRTYDYMGMMDTLAETSQDKISVQSSNVSAAGTPIYLRSKQEAFR